MTRVLVCGGRDFNDRKTVKFYLDQIHKSRHFTCLIHGSAKGADTQADIWAREAMVPIKVYPADWKKDGRAAGPIRNLRMLTEGKPDLVIAFPGGRGTAHMCKIAEAHGVQVVKIPDLLA